MADRNQRGQQQCRDISAQRHLPRRLDAPAHQVSKITDGTLDKRGADFRQS